jgi:hypothetical protein
MQLSFLLNIFIWIGQVKERRTTACAVPETKFSFTEDEYGTVLYNIISEDKPLFCLVSSQGDSTVACAVFGPAEVRPNRNGSVFSSPYS